MKRLFIYISLFLILPVTYAQQFRFALITDTHVTHGGTAAEDLQLTVDHINAGEGINFVLVTGDITEEGDRQSLQKAKDILDQLNIKYNAIPGNHETTWSESGMTAFGDIYGSERFSFEYEGVLFLGFNTGPFIRMADGHVVPQDISWLKQELEKWGTEKPVILVTHYPLKEGDVDNWFDVTDAVRPYNIRTFVGGHYHRNLTFSYDGIPGILNRSNLRGKEETGGYTLYEVTPDSILVYEQVIGKEPQQWTSLSMKKKYYEQKGDPEKYPDYSINNEFPQVKEEWLVKTGVGIYSSPSYYDGKVYVGDDMGYLTCYNGTDGKKQWQFKSGHRIVGTPETRDGVVVFGSADKKYMG